LLAALLHLRYAQTTYIDFASGAGRKALRRCPDLSRKRDGIVVRALSFLPSPLLEANRLLRSAPLDREDRRLRHARRRRRHVRGVTESLPSERRTNVVSSRRVVGAVQTYRGVNASNSCIYFWTSRKFYAYKSSCVPVVSGASDFDIIPFMKEIVLCLVSFFDPEIDLMRIVSRGADNVRVESKISSTGFSLFVR
jgi:hypothetical protein